jgi:RIO-like serine/threonine protein kinase
LQALKGQYDFSGLKFEEITNDGRTATVRLSGKLLLKVLGQEQAYQIYEDIGVVKESDVWKVCSNAANLLK